MQQEVSSRNRIRLSVSLFYFGQGLGFASWASRIPEIKLHLNLTDAQFGSILLGLPLGQLLMMPISGRLVTAFGSHKTLPAVIPFYVLALTNIGLVNTGWQLALCLFLFGIIGNVCNISLNTQAVAAEKMYGSPIMTSFHGVWSLGGLAGALIGMLIIKLQWVPYTHFWIITGLVWLNVLLNFKHLAAGQTKLEAPVAEKTKRFKMPESVLLQLGIIGFCCMATEGAMFDWSGVYFKDIVHAPAAFVVLGYASFMSLMATGRLLGDKIIQKYGRKRWLQVSGLLISSGMFLAVIFPYLPTATIGFMFVGMGVSGIVPMVYTIAGNSKTVAPGMALATVSGVSYFGFLLGPPLIGYVSALSSLRYSYALIGILGLFISIVVAKISAVR